MLIAAFTSSQVVIAQETISIHQFTSTHWPELFIVDKAESTYHLSSSAMSPGCGVQPSKHSISWRNTLWIKYCSDITKTILCMRPSNERRRYSVTPSFIGWAHAQNGPCITWASWHFKWSATRVFLLKRATRYRSALPALCEGNAPVSDRFPLQRASGLERVSQCCKVWAKGFREKVKHELVRSSFFRALPGFPKGLTGVDLWHVVIISHHT